MLKKIFYWFLGFTLLLLLAAGVVLWFTNDYLESNQEKLLHDYLGTKGLAVSLRGVKLEVWKDFPEISLSLDSIVVRDTTKTYLPKPLLSARRIETEISLASMLAGRIRIKEIVLRDAEAWLIADSTGAFNAGTWLEKDTTSSPVNVEVPSLVSLDWEGLCSIFHNVDVHYIHEERDKRIEVLARRLETTVDENESGNLRAIAQLDLDVGTMTLKGEKGGYLKNTPVEGLVAMNFGPEYWTVEPTELMIGGQLYRASAEFDTNKERPSTIRLSCDTVQYDRTYAVLNDDLQEKLSEYDATGQFAVDATIVTPLSGGANPEVTIDFNMTGQDVKLKQYQFGKVYGKARLVNRLTPAEGGIPDSKKNIRVTTDSIQAYYLEKILIESPGIKVAIANKDPLMTAGLHLSGEASGVSDYLKNDEFFFRQGRFTMDADIARTSLLDLEACINNTDGNIKFYDTEVFYEPAGVSFPFRGIAVDKVDQDISFVINSQPLPSGVAFDLAGRLDNIIPLLTDEPAQRITTDVTLHTQRMNWTDWRALFSPDGQFGNLVESDGGEAEPNEPGKTQATVRDSSSPPGSDTATGEVSDVDQVRAMKATLVGIERDFNPDIDLQFDTVNYYDVMQLTEFTTGLHFAGDTLVLDSTAFNWAGSEMRFGARVAMGLERVTPFTVDFQADHLNVNEFTPALDYFGVAFPKGVDRLPEDMHIDFSHAGRIADSIGIAQGHNTGKFVFDDGKSGLFSGELTYTPGPLGLQSTVHLDGDPRIINVLFNSENFFFGEGRFSLDLDLERTPEAAPDLLRYGGMRLRVDSSRIHYIPTDVFVPVRQFSVDVSGGRAAYYLSLVTDSTNREVTVRGDVGQVSSFLFPDTTLIVAEPLAVTADVYARTLGYEDLQEFFQSSSDGDDDDDDNRGTTGENDQRKDRGGETNQMIENPTSESDTASFNVTSALSTTGSIFKSFRPDLSLLVDTLWLSSSTPLVGVATGMRIVGDTLELERTGFSYGEGRVQLDATYLLDDQPRSPFNANWYIDDLPAGQLITDFKLLANQAGSMTGNVFFTGNVTGTLDERTRKIEIDNTDGNVNIALSELSAAGWPGLVRAGKKAFMAHRFDTVAAAPLAIAVGMHDGLAYIPRTEVQTTALQLFVEGWYDTDDGPDILVSVPVFANLWRGDLKSPPAKTGYANAGWKVFLVMTEDEDSNPTTKFRLGRKKFFKRRGRLAEFRAIKQHEKVERRAKRKR